MTGIKLKALRLAAGLTQQALADIAGLNARQIQRLERGDVAPGDMAAKNLFAIADALHINPRVLIEEENKMKKYYFPNDEHIETFFGSEYPVCVDLAELYRLANGWDKSVDDLMEQMHEASESEIAEFGVYDS